MGVSGYNSEGYLDPTTYGALSKIENEMKVARAYRPIAYVCSPFAGNMEENTANAREYCRFAMECGYISILLLKL